jgi:hypothetical protein
MKFQLWFSPKQVLDLLTTWIGKSTENYAQTFYTMAEKVVLAALENDDDLLLLSSLKEEKVLAYQKLDIDNLTNDQCRTMFRFGNFNFGSPQNRF